MSIRLKPRRPSASTGFQVAVPTGRYWSEHIASAEQLRNLDLWLGRMPDRATPDWDRWFDDHENGAYSAAERLYFAIDPDCRGDRKASGQFWLSVAKDDAPDGGFVQGFVEGVLDGLDQNGSAESI